jgi:hypothetical protein
VPRLRPQKRPPVELPPIEYVEAVDVIRIGQSGIAALKGDRFPLDHELVREHPEFFVIPARRLSARREEVS